MTYKTTARNATAIDKSNFLAEIKVGMHRNCLAFLNPFLPVEIEG